MLAPFAVRAYRFQYPADLLTSWGIEMEILILNWYVLVTTNSVLLLTAFNAMQYFGTLLAPVLGMAGDRFSQRIVMMGMRVVYASLGVAMFLLSATGMLMPVHVFIVAFLAGLLKPSAISSNNKRIE